MFKLQIDKETKESKFYENSDYAFFWNGIQQEKLDALEQMLVKTMLHLPAERMIDIGCGYGRLLDCYQEKSKEIVLLDSSRYLLQQAYEQTKGRALCIACDLHHIPFQNGAFDQVMMVRVFHHLPDSAAALTELNRLLVPGGHLLFSYCNKMNLERVFLWLIGKNPYMPYRLETAWVWEYFFMHHPGFVRQALQAAGFGHIRKKGAGILDKLAGKLGKLGKSVPPGAALASLFGELGLAPWIFVDAAKTGDRQQIPDLPLEKLMQCIGCGGHLTTDSAGLTCLECGRKYPLIGGVYYFDEVEN